MGKRDMTIKTILMCAVAAAGVVQAAEAPAVPAADAASAIVFELSREEEERLVKLINEAIAELEQVGGVYEGCCQHEHNERRAIAAGALCRTLKGFVEARPIMVGSGSEMREFVIRNAEGNNLVRIPNALVFPLDKGDLKKKVDAFWVWQRRIRGHLTEHIIPLTIIVVVLLSGGISSIRGIDNDAGTALGVYLCFAGSCFGCCLLYFLHAFLLSGKYKLKKHWKAQDVLDAVDSLYRSSRAIRIPEAAEVAEVLPEIVGAAGTLSEAV
jgi:hypothetical protein